MRNIIYKLKKRFFWRLITFPKIINSLYSTGLYVFLNMLGVFVLYTISAFASNVAHKPLVIWPGIDTIIHNGTLLLATISLYIKALHIKKDKITKSIISLIATVCLTISIVLYVVFIKTIGGSINIELPSHWQYLNFTASCIILFLSFLKKSVLGDMLPWVQEAETARLRFSIFFAYALTSTQDDKHVKDVDSIYKCFNDLGYNIFDADKFFDLRQGNQQPSIAAIEDFAAIENSKNLIFFYPESAPTSALIELGYAIKKGIKIIVITPSIDTLPFLLRGLMSKVEIFEYKNDLNSLLINFRKHHSTILK